MTEVRSWHDQAACLELVSADYDPFFADTKDLQAEAIAICATCPVRDACLTFAVRSGHRFTAENTYYAPTASAAGGSACARPNPPRARRRRPGGNADVA